jgi:four helix bundle protein
MAMHERFEAWQVAHALALEVFAVSDRWPRSELYIITAQVRRAALSIPCNIAEGAARHGRKEFARYLNIALGSLAELRYLLRFSRDRGLGEECDWERLTALTERTGRLLFGLYRRLRCPV